MKTWQVLEWPNKPQRRRSLSLICPHCATDAQLEVGETPGGTIIAAIGLGIIFDPPSYIPPSDFLPDTVRCRTCRRIFSHQEEVDVR